MRSLWLFSSSSCGESPFPSQCRCRIVVCQELDPAVMSREVSLRTVHDTEEVRRVVAEELGNEEGEPVVLTIAELLDNAMDEAVAGHASWIEVSLDPDGFLTVTDNGRGVPVDPHPRFPDKTALEVIMTTLHSGGKFDSKVYQTSGGLHGVGVSVVNALSEQLEVEVARNRRLYRQTYGRGEPLGPVEDLGETMNRRGTKVRFRPDPEIFGRSARFKPARLFRMTRSKAYLFRGVEIRWACAPGLLPEDGSVPEREVFHFPSGLKDFLLAEMGNETLVVGDIFAGRADTNGLHGGVEWAIAWFASRDGFMSSYCNTVPTPDGGTHEAGLRSALLRGLRAHAELTGRKRAQLFTADDVMASCGAMLSVFIREPEFQGQTKDRLATAEATRVVEQAVRDEFDHWLGQSPQQAQKLLDWVIDRAEERLRRRQEKEIGRKTAVRKLRLPGKLADCSATAAAGSELFIVDGDSAGGSAKQARDRKIQAVLPLRGKILNVESAGSAKLSQNQQLSDLVQALGCGTGANYRETDLRYDKIIIMCDADVDGAHIASLLMTFFYRQMPGLIDEGHLYLAVPPLYRLSQGGRTLYARDDAHKAELLANAFIGRGKVEVSRFKGLGEMLPAQLKETTMNPATRMLLRVAVADQDRDGTTDAVSRLMGNVPEARFRFIQDNAEFARDLDV
jgi:topoisomerase IV subunit B